MDHEFPEQEVKSTNEETQSDMGREEAIVLSWVFGSLPGGADIEGLAF